MSTIQIFSRELEQEARITRKMLQRVPDDKYDWRPHQKSMTIRQLATHVAELPSWVSLTLTTPELDFGIHPYQPEEINNTTELMDYFEKTLADGKAHLARASDDQLSENWTYRNGDQIYFSHPKDEVIRMTYNQIVHHRAQLGVYLRLLNIPIPGSYGPSADEE
jgi:uncharacterized damage-inducible protein DinB